MKFTLNISSVFLVLIAFASCKSSDQEMKSGIWRAVLKTNSAAEIPFNFEVIDSAGAKYINIINGEERFRVDEISFTSDSVFIKMPLFDSEIKAKNKGSVLSGQWIKHLADSDAVMAFDARAGDDWRFFKASKSQEANISGRWSTTFTSLDSADTTIAVGEFRNDNGRLLGTFLTSTGDYRFLEGTVSDNKLYLSCFDGGHAYLFTANVLNDSTITDGKFYSGYAGVENWNARKDENAILPDAYSLTALKKGYNKIDFTFPALDGRKVSILDEKYKNKIVLVQFLGSWCPNCMDETAYLVPFYNKYKDKGVEIIGLAYERTKDFERSRKNVSRLRDRFNVPYEMLITGYTNDKAEVATSIPMLNNFEAFPTLMIIDKKGVVRKIHTGFSGPGTGEYYTKFVQEFEQTIDDLLAEK
ncbi:peroxiredoxin family protein [Daejeonella lutea]|uniref:Peroxiredoxin n=1 Tax=Daejeonella lutea TaxID=572036 RepID=A0A1T5DFE0_9SPHI|nr:TlpA disulfide reductase family protein [Daejeonella lutea]SKB70409.1 Peroxiredoxin [Daejeonella lutea]